MSNEMILKTVYIIQDLDTYGVPEKGSEFMAFWQGQLDKIPKEFMDSALIEIDSESDRYGGSSVNMQVSYKRPESDREIEARIKHEFHYAKRDADQKRLQYERLKKELNL
tara:strand:- start:268 stop:597 length:330 start_codon:yes stop_codon:yes gene_type:complete